MTFRSLSTRTPALVAAGATLALVAGGTAVYATGGTTVELSVDGDARALELRGDTVADVLSAAGLEVGEHDQLTPSADTQIDDGDLVSLRRARPLQLVVDGAARTVWVTSESVDEALQEVGVRADGAALSASRSREIGLDGLSLDVRLPKTVTVLVDGTSVPRTTTGATVADLLAEAGVVVRPQDRVSVPLDGPLVDQTAVAVFRVDEETVVEQVPVPAGTVRRDDPSALVGTEKVLQQGRAGVLSRTTVVNRVDGVETGRTVTGEVRTTEATPTVIGVGTKPKPVPVPIAPRPAPAPQRPAASVPAPTGGGGLNWAALARCESGGNPRAVSSTGKYHGLYQFSVQTWAAVGGSGLPSQASAAEQTARAQILYNRSGRGQWPVCGRYL